MIKVSLPSSHLAIPLEGRVSLWDLDNCLADDAHRIPLINWSLEHDERYEAYNREMLRDTVQNLHWFKVLEAVTTPIFFTGRPAAFRKQTEAWIRQHLGLHTPLVFMRGGPGKPAEVKYQMLQDLYEGWDLGPLHVSAAFDDLPSVVSMYEDNLIPGVLLQVHNPEMAYSPQDI